MFDVQRLRYLIIRVWFAFAILYSVSWCLHAAKFWANSLLVCLYFATCSLASLSSVVQESENIVYC